MSLLMQNKPIFESTHVTTGLAGMGLLTVQALLPAFFSSGSGEARTGQCSSRSMWFDLVFLILCINM